MQQATKNRIFDLVAPLILGLGFLVKIILNILFGWWLFPLLQWKNSRAFMKEVKLKWGSLLSRTSSMTVAAGDSPTITIAQDNLLFTLVRWHDETAIRVAPRHVPAESYEVGLLIAAIEQRHYSEHDIVNDLEGAEKMLLPRLDALNAAFSEQRYSRIREKL